MAFLAVDKNGEEYIFAEKPQRHSVDWFPNPLMEDSSTVFLPSGSIQKLIGRELMWEDEAVEI